MRAATPTSARSSPRGSSTGRLTSRRRREKYNDGLTALSADMTFLKEAAGRVKGLYAELPATFAKKTLREIFSVASELKLPLVAGGDAHFVTSDRHGMHRVLSAIRENALVDNLPASAVAPESAYLGRPRRWRLFTSSCRRRLTTRARLPRGATSISRSASTTFPHTGVPEGESPFSYLSRLAFEGARERYHPITPEVVNRLAHELDVIQKLNFPEYFLIVEDIVRFARGAGIPIAGRGSAADSLVAYCLGITIVDPIDFDLYFERFLNLSRTDCPDIDLDICWRRRDEVIDYVYKKYGHTRVAMVSTYITFQARSAFRDVARVYGLPMEEIDDLSKRPAALRRERHRGSGQDRARGGGLPHRPRAVQVDRRYRRGASTATRGTSASISAASSSATSRSRITCRSRWPPRASSSASTTCTPSRIWGS